MHYKHSDILMEEAAWCGEPRQGYDSQADEANELELAIHDRNADLVIRAITTLRRPQSKGHALWSVVGSLFGIGSTSAIRLCRKHGFDPDMRVKRRIDL